MNRGPCPTSCGRARKGNSSANQDASARYLVVLTLIKGSMTGLAPAEDLPKIVDQTSKGRITERALPPPTTNLVLGHLIGLRVTFLDNSINLFRNPAGVFLKIKLNVDQFLEMQFCLAF